MSCVHDHIKLLYDQQLYSNVVTLVSINWLLKIHFTMVKLVGPLQSSDLCVVGRTSADSE